MKKYRVIFYKPVACGRLNGEDLMKKECIIMAKNWKGCFNKVTRLFGVKVAWNAIIQESK